MHFLTNVIVHNFYMVKALIIKEGNYFKTLPTCSLYDQHKNK